MMHVLLFVLVTFGIRRGVDEVIYIFIYFLLSLLDYSP
jgi:hypothetical protein